jgi:EamA domain-containing membrane protein RarD
MKKNKNIEFSKKLLNQESALIWITTISMIVLAFICVKNQYFGELPWLAAMVGFPWAAYGVSQACYYKKAEKENTKGGIKYETIMAEYSEDEAVG